MKHTAKFEIIVIQDNCSVQGVQSTGRGHLRGFTRHADGAEEHGRWFKDVHNPKAAWVAV